MHHFMQLMMNARESIRKNTFQEFCEEFDKHCSEVFLRICFEYLCPLYQ